MFKKITFLLCALSMLCSLSISLNENSFDTLITNEKKCDINNIYELSNKNKKMKDPDNDKGELIEEDDNPDGWILFKINKNDSTN